MFAIFCAHSAQLLSVVAGSTRNLIIFPHCVRGRSSKSYFLASQKVTKKDVSSANAELRNNRKRLPRSTNRQRETLAKSRTLHSTTGHCPAWQQKPCMREVFLSGCALLRWEFLDFGDLRTTSTFTQRKATGRLGYTVQATFPPPSTVVSDVSMYTSTLVSRFPIGFVARGVRPKGVFPEAATSSRWKRALFGNFLSLLTKSYSPSGET